MGMGKLGYSVLTRQAGHDFVTHHDLPALLDEVRPDCVLTDFQMGLVDGLDVAQAVHEHDAHMPLVLHTNALDALPANHPSLAYVSAMRPKPTQGELKRHCALVDNVFRSAMHNHGKADLFSNREHER